MDDRRHDAAAHVHRLRRRTSRASSGRARRSPSTPTSDAACTFECSLDGGEPDRRAPRRSTIPRAGGRRAQLRGHARCTRSVFDRVGEPIEPALRAASRRSTRGRSSTRRRPTRSILYGPAATRPPASTPTSASASSDPTAIVECSLDFEGFSGCEPHDDVRGPARRASTSLQVRAVDEADNADPTPATLPLDGRRAPRRTRPVGHERDRRAADARRRPDATVNFFEVSVAGATTVEQARRRPAARLPGYGLVGGRYYDITTTADYGDPVRALPPLRPGRLRPSAPPACSSTTAASGSTSRSPTTRPPGGVCGELEDFALFALAGRHRRARRWRRSSPGRTGLSDSEHARRSPSSPTCPDAMLQCSIDGAAVRRPCDVADHLHVPRDRRPQVRGPGDRLPDEPIDADSAARALRVGGRAAARHDAARHADRQGPAAADRQLDRRSSSSPASTTRRSTSTSSSSACSTASCSAPASPSSPRRACPACRTRSRSRTARSASTRSRSARSTRSGNVDPTPATRTWTYVDLTAPDTVDRARPGGGDRGHDRDLRVPRRGPERARRSSTSSARSTAPTSRPAPRRTTIEGLTRRPARASRSARSDPTGVVDPTPELYEWLIIPPFDTTPPDTFIAHRARPGLRPGRDLRLPERTSSSRSSSARSTASRSQGCDAVLELEGLDRRPAHAPGPRDRPRRQRRPDAGQLHLDRRRRARDDDPVRPARDQRPRERDLHVQLRPGRTRPSCARVDGSPSVACTSPFIAGPLIQDGARVRGLRGQRVPLHRRRARPGPDAGRVRVGGPGRRRRRTRRSCR